MFDINANHFISLIFSIGLGQLLWLFYNLCKRGIAPTTLWQAYPPLFAVWVLIWPVYEQPIWIFSALGLLLGLTVLSGVLKHPFWKSLHIIWSDGNQIPNRIAWPMLSLISALGIAATIFQYIPEFGFGLALSACLSFSLANLLDRAAYLKLGMPLNPQQTLLGHIGFILSTSFLCSWSIHLYHGIHWQQLLIATLITAMAASIIRATLPEHFQRPTGILTMGWILWLL
ncbi:MAG: hypothetical protein R8K49_00555 [Mariprofundaceae bacterium]